MKNKDEIILSKILDYCNQVDEACEMFDNDCEKFETVSVFQNACCMCVWDTIQNDLPELKINIERILADINAN